MRCRGRAREPSPAPTDLSGDGRRSSTLTKQLKGDQSVSHRPQQPRGHGAIRALSVTRKGLSEPAWPRGWACTRSRQAGRSASSPAEQESTRRASSRPRRDLLRHRVTRLVSEMSGGSVHMGTPEQITPDVNAGTNRRGFIARLATIAASLPSRSRSAIRSCSSVLSHPTHDGRTSCCAVAMSPRLTGEASVC